MVKEVDVDTVRVMGGADRSNGTNGLANLVPRPASHRPRVVDHEDGIECGEESVLVFGAGNVREAGYR
jgi:hypothetical protein